jgi:hypothetical protein
VALSNEVIVSIIGAGGLAVGGGLFKLGLSIGGLNATVKAIDKRLESVEEWQDDREDHSRMNRRPHT